MYRPCVTLALLAAMSSAAAFVPSVHRTSARAALAMADDDTDFDAPVPANPSQATGPLASAPVVDDECYMGKSNQSKDCVDFDPPAKAEDASARVKFAAVDDDTDFDAPIPANPAQASGPLAGAPVVDDECYMGKSNALEDCADFDPPAKAEDASARVKFAAVDDDTDFDAPVPANPAQASGPLAGAPVVDDECYMGKDNQLEECVDFDP